MPKSETPSFNLWIAPWITLEHPSGGAETVGIAAALLRAHEFMAVYDLSPLVIAGTHRLLTAIAQAIFDPQRPNDIKALWRAGQFPAERIEAFGARYADRFDLFSESAPFFQSADLPVHPTKAEQDKLKSISQLTVETSRTTALQHYRHGREMEEQFCPTCAARGLVTIPMFITSGGRGLKTSINGEPPIYVIPGGETLYQSLTASVLLPDYQPAVRARSNDTPWWEHAPIVTTGDVDEIGYLHSLTFPARRVRLIPEQPDGSCTRCGQASKWVIREMFFEAGECRSKEAKETQFWQDPFVAYRQSGEKKPVPIRSQAGKALWREFVGLLVSHTDEEQKGKGRKALRPRVLDQISDRRLADDVPTYPVRCIGPRTRMGQPKIFEWLDTGFDVPPAILRDADVAHHISKALEFADECEKGILAVFRQFFGGKFAKSERNKHLKEQMRDNYWATLAEPFRLYVLALGAAGNSEARKPISGRWADNVIDAAWTAFKQAADAVGDDAASLRQRVQGENRCRYTLNVKHKKFWIERSNPDE
ncbi:MAG: type I-E CRISPR-associated protein Cse1/CasA [Anaerolineae bacterium]|nr:type I-E CRISPR-associated protein Cse1/CasA [Anaerolineae bacterium]